MSVRIVMTASLVIATVYILFRITTGITGVPETVAAYVSYPMLVAQRIITQPLENYAQHRRSYATMHQKLAELSGRNQQLEQELSELKVTLNDLEQTEELRLFAPRYKSLSQVDPESLLTVQILMKHLEADEQYFLIQAGSKQGIQQDMVAVYKNCLLGRVTEIYEYYSKLLLVTDKRCKVSAYCGKNRVTGIHEGINSREYTVLNHVAHLSPVTVGERIVSSGEGLVFPKGFGLGLVKSAEQKGLYYDVTVEPLIDISQLSHCIILHKRDII